jgi:hypothetical protein
MFFAFLQFAYPISFYHYHRNRKFPALAKSPPGGFPLPPFRNLIHPEAKNH